MKKIFLLLSLITLFILIATFSSELGLTVSAKKIQRPSNLPPNLPFNWGSFEQQAFEDGRLTYNNDSTICWIENDRLISKEHVEAALRSRNSIVIQFQ